MHQAIAALGCVSRADEHSFVHDSLACGPIKGADHGGRLVQMIGGGYGFGGWWFRCKRWHLQLATRPIECTLALHMAVIRRMLCAGLAYGAYGVQQVRDELWRADAVLCTFFYFKRWRWSPLPAKPC